MADRKEALRKVLLALSDLLRQFAGAPPASYQPLAELARAKPPAPPQRHGLELDLELPAERRSQPADVGGHGDSILTRLRDPRSVRDALVLAEILDRPRALRPLRR